LKIDRLTTKLRYYAIDIYISNYQELPYYLIWNWRWN